MSPRSKAYDLPSAMRRAKNQRRARLQSRIASTKQEKAVKKSRKDELFENLVAQEQDPARFELAVDEKDAGIAAVEAGEQRHQDLMNGPEAPEWSRPVLKPVASTTPSGTREDITVRLSQLDAEQKELREKLEKSMEEQRAVLQAQLDEQVRQEQE